MVYFISGLGADERVFQFLDLSGIAHRFIKWLQPLKDESLKNYATRLTTQIDPHQEIILIGISFGGIVAQELARLVPCKKVIIISSIKSHTEFSWPMALVRKTQIHKMIPTWLLAASNRFTADYYFNTETKAESKLLHQIIKDTDPVFLRWAIDQIMNWHNISYPENLIHLHGTKDRIFPIQKITNAVQIPKSGHFMIVNQAKLVERLIFELIKEN